MTAGRDGLVERLRNLADDRDEEGCEGDAEVLREAVARIADLETENVRLREHIAEQMTHAETRIQDGIEMGAVIWRIALEDITRESRAALNGDGA